MNKNNNGKHLYEEKILSSFRLLNFSFFAPSSLACPSVTNIIFYIGVHVVVLVVPAAVAASFVDIHHI